MKKTAQILCFILAMVFVLSLLPMNAFAAEPTPAPAAESAPVETPTSATEPPADGNTDPQPTAEFTVTVEGGTADKTTAVEGEVITLTPGTVDGKVFVAWKSDMVTVENNQFTMPASNVEVTAEFAAPAVTLEESVAQVGDVYYKTLQEAVNAADNNEVDLTKDVDITNGGLTVAGNVTLNLAGHTITANSSTGNIQVTGILTLDDSGETGKILANQSYPKDDDSYSNGVVRVSGEDAKLIMAGGTIETVLAGAPNEDNEQRLAVVLTDGADMEMEDGIIYAGGYAVSVPVQEKYIDLSSKIEICGGELTSEANYTINLPQAVETVISRKEAPPALNGAKGCVNMQGGTISISDGKFVAKDEGTAAVSAGGNAGVTITGGSFNSAPSETCVPFGYKAVEANGVFTVARAQEIVSKDDNGVTVVDGIFNGGEQPSVNVGANGEMKIARHTVDSIINAGTGFTAANGTTAVTFDGTAMSKATGQEAVISIKDAAGIEGASAVYSIGFTAAGANLMPEGAEGNGNVTVSLAKPEGVNDPQVWYVVNGVFVQNMNAEVKGDKLVFTTNHLSDYAVTDGKPAASAIVKYVDKTSGAEVYDDSLVNAVNNVKSGETITLLGDVENGSGVIVPSGSDFTIDFANHTYTVTGNLAGSQGTETQCFQLLKDSTITMKNGAIVANNPQIAMIIQNYSNLTLDNMVLDATKGKNGVDYVVSNNYGNTVIGSGTVITAKPEKAAFDVYNWPEGGYNSVSVTVKAGAVVNGNVEYAADGTSVGNGSYAENAKLNFEGGTLNGEIKPAANVAEKAGITVSGGAFTTDPTAFVADGSAVAEIANGGENKFYVGEENIKNAASTLGKGDTVTVNQGSVALGNLPHGVEVINKGDGVVSANNNTVPKGESLVSCNHPEIKEVAERPATCKEEGMKAHWQCVGADGCGKLFKKNEDGSFTMLTKDEEDALVIPLADHKLDKVEAVQPTCGKEGVKEHWHCSVCEKNFSDAAGKNEVSDKDLAIPAVGEHKLTEIKEVKATCTANGVKAHWHCDNCGKNYADAEGKNELTDEELVIPATGHNPGIWRDNDEQHWRVCRNCGEKLDLADHSYGEWVITREPTERLSGRRERECTVCGYIDRDRIPATHGPKTADESNLVLWVTLLSLSAVATTGTVAYMGYKKKHNK